MPSKGMFQKSNIKVLEWASPVVQKKKEANTDGHHVAKRSLFNSSEFRNKYSYISPIELEIDLNQKEIVPKEKEV